MLRGLACPNSHVTPKESQKGCTWWWRLEAEQESLPPSLGLLLPPRSSTARRFCTSCWPDVQDRIPTGRLWQRPLRVEWQQSVNKASSFSFFFFSYSIILHLMSLFLVPKLPVVYSVHSFHQYFLILMTFHGRGCSLECQHCFPQPEAVGREGERREREAGGEGRQGCINYSERSRGSRCDDTDCRNYDKCSDLHPTPIR